MNHSEEMNSEATQRRSQRRMKSLIRCFIKVLHSSYSEYLTSTTFINHPLPTEDQYNNLKSFLATALSGGIEPSLVEVTDAVAEVIGREAVGNIINNISSVSGDLLMNIYISRPPNHFCLNHSRSTRLYARSVSILESLI